MGLQDVISSLMCGILMWIVLAAEVCTFRDRSGRGKGSGLLSTNDWLADVVDEAGFEEQWKVEQCFREGLKNRDQRCMKQQHRLEILAVFNIEQGTTNRDRWDHEGWYLAKNRTCFILEVN